MVSQVKPVLCPKCKKSALGIDRVPGGRPDLTAVEVYHHDTTVANCVFKMSWADAQDLANSITRDIGGRK